MTNKAWKAIDVLACTVGAVAFFTSTFLWTYYDHTQPGVLDAGAGQTYPLNTHGSIVYLTWPEQLWLYSLIGVARVCFGLAIVIDVVKKPFRGRYDPR